MMIYKLNFGVPDLISGALRTIRYVCLEYIDCSELVTLYFLSMLAVVLDYNVVVVWD